VVTSIDEKGPRLTIAPLHPEDLSVSIVKGKRDVPVQGWTCSVRGNRKAGDRMLAVPTAIYKAEWLNARDIITVLYPTPEGEQPGMTTEPVVVDGDGLGGRFILPDGARHTYLAGRAPGRRSEPMGSKQMRKSLPSARIRAPSCAWAWSTVRS